MMGTDSVSWALITRTRSRKALGLGRKRGLNTIIPTRASGSAFTTTKTPSRCSLTFGRKSTRFWSKGSRSHEHSEDWNCIARHIQEAHIGDRQRRIQAWEERPQSLV